VLFSKIDCFLNCIYLDVDLSLRKNIRIQIFSSFKKIQQAAQYKQRGVIKIISSVFLLNDVSQEFKKRTNQILNKNSEKCKQTK